MSVLSTILPTDVHADIILRGVEEGTLTRDRAEALAARESGDLLYAVRARLSALVAFQGFQAGVLPVTDAEREAQHVRRAVEAWES